MTLLVYKIHSLNFVLFWALSFFFEIVAYEMNPLFGRFRTKRINRLEWERYFSADEIICLRSEALTAWEKILLRFPLRPWQVSHDGRVVDFSKKAKQELGACFEHLFLFREIQRKSGAKLKLHIIKSSEFAYLSNFMEPDIFSYDSSPVISGLNAVCDDTHSYLSVFLEAASLSYHMIKACLTRRTDNRTLKPPVHILWDAVNPGEMYLSPEKLTFPWIIDGNYVRNEELVFLIPKMEKKVMQEIKASPYQAFTLEQLCQIIPRLVLLNFISELGILIPKIMFLSFFKFENRKKGQYLVRALRYKPIVDYLRPATYITSISSIGYENPVEEYFNSIDIKTIMYCYSANSYLWTDGHCKTDFRTIQFAHIMCSTMVVWHEQFKKFIQEHPQEKLEVKVVGPLMAGDQTVCGKTTSLRASYVPQSNNLQDLKYVSIFDVAAMSKSGRSLYRVYPNSYTEEYCLSFLKDMLNLIYDLDKVFILMKIKRDVNNPFAYSHDRITVLDSMKASGRGLILQESINPWIPIALADLFISIPFTSPTLAAMNYGKPALFHDAMGLAKYHRYQDMSAYITHSYEELKGRVKFLLFSSHLGTKNDYSEAAAKAGFVGRHLGTNSSDEFRKYLKSLRGHK